MKVLVEYERLVSSATQRFCNPDLELIDQLPREVCTELHAIRAELTEASRLVRRNQVIVRTIEERYSAADLAASRGLPPELPRPDIEALQEEISELERSVSALEEVARDALRRHDHDEHAADDYFDALTMLESKRHQRLMLVADDFNARMQRNLIMVKTVSETLKSIGQLALLNAALRIVADFPDDLSVWSYHRYRTRLRGRKLLRGIKHSEGWSEAIAMAIELALHTEVKLVILILQGILKVSAHGVHTREDVAALIAQRPHLQGLVEQFRKQNAHMEPLMAASEVSLS